MNHKRQKTGSVPADPDIVELQNALPDECISLDASEVQALQPLFKALHEKHPELEFKLLEMPISKGVKMYAYAPTAQEKAVMSTVVSNSDAKQGFLELVKKCIPKNEAKHSVNDCKK